MRPYTHPLAGTNHLLHSCIRKNWQSPVCCPAPSFSHRLPLATRGKEFASVRDCPLCLGTPAIPHWRGIPNFASNDLLKLWLKFSSPPVRWLPFSAMFCQRSNGWCALSLLAGACSLWEFTFLGCLVTSVLWYAQEKLQFGRSSIFFSH